MEFEDVLGNAKWDILAEVAKGERAASDIARATGTSLANISQQTKLLEAWGLLKLGKEPKTGAGKPKLLYRLNKEVAHLAIVRHGYAAKRTLSFDSTDEPLLNILFVPKSEDRYYLFKFLCQHEEYLRQCQAVALVDADDKELHLLVLAPEARLDMFRKNYSKVSLKAADGKPGKSIITWTHSAQELRDGFAKGEDYYINFLKKHRILVDPNEELRLLIQEAKEVKRSEG